MDDTLPETQLNLARWLVEVKKLVLGVARRSRVLQELCPMSDFGEPSRTQSLKSLAEVTTEIDEYCERLRQIEKDVDYQIGCGVLLGNSIEPSQPLFIATALLIGARLHRGLRTECRMVGEIVDLSTGGCPVSVLLVRDAFRAPEGVLLGWVHLRSECNIDQCNVDLTDSALALVCGRMPTDIENAHAVLGAGEANPFRMQR